jgi:hypothetical protein
MSLVTRIEPVIALNRIDPPRIDHRRNAQKTKGTPCATLFFMPRSTLRLPPKPPSDAEIFSGHFLLAIENRFELAGPSMTPVDAVTIVLSALEEARKEMGWA